MTSPANQTMQMLEAIIARQPRHNSTINTHSIQCVPSAAGEPFANLKISKKIFGKKVATEVEDGVSLFSLPRWGLGPRLR